MTDYIEEKIGIIIFLVFYLLFLVLFLWLFQVPGLIIVVFALVYLLVFIVFFVVNYWKEKKNYQNIVKEVDNLEEKYLISEIIRKPKSIENLGYYYALKEACKTMNDKITNIDNERKEYQEYIESFAHEIKTPIAALSLYADNNKDEVIKEEINKINNWVEQVLFYARSENPEKDYFVKKLNLEEVIHGVILDYKDTLLKLKISLNIHDLENEIFTDEKWLSFIISQVIQNAIKYRNKNNNEIEIYSENSKNMVMLVIKDRGIGILGSDLPRVFEKGFTGSNRNKEYATGMGLYLCKKLCDKLNLDIIINSEVQKYTEVRIKLPKSDYNLKIISR